MARCYTLAALLLAALLFTPIRASARPVHPIGGNLLAATVSLDVQGADGVSFRRGNGFFVRDDPIVASCRVIDGAAKGGRK